MTRPVEIPPPDDAPYDASDESQVQRAQRRTEGRRRRDKDDLLWLLADARGRRFVWRLIEQAGVFRSSFTGTSATFFNEGRRSLGLAILAQVTEADPAAHAAMIQENRSSDARQSPAPADGD